MADLPANNPGGMEAWIADGRSASHAEGECRIRCPACGALLANFVRGVFLKRCWRCKVPYLVIAIPGVVQAISPFNRVYVDEAYRVNCPLCGVPLGEYLIGVFRITCYYCKWGGVITRNATSLVQSFTTLQEPKWKNTAWQPGKPASEEPLRE